MAQKRKAEDEVSAMGNEELGDTAAPAAKKVKAESDERTPLPATTVAAARDGGMASTTADTNKASNTPALPAPSFAASAGAEVASAHSDSLAAATAADSDIKAEPELAEAGAKPEVAEAKQEDAEAKPEDADADMADEYAEDPQTLGYKTFKSGDEAFQYFHDLMHNLRQNQDLNEVRTKT